MQEAAHKEQQRLNEELRKLIHMQFSAINWEVEAIERSVGQLLNEYGNSVLSFMFELILPLQFTNEEAFELWGRVMEHYRKMCKGQKITMDFRALCFNYMLQNNIVMSDPVLVERKAVNQLYQKTLTDEVTGLYNVRFLRQSIDREISRARRRGTSCSMIFIDLDHFKEINDNYGHEFGNQILKEVANRIIGCVRTSDLPCRYGGDEFAILAPDTNSKGALLLADRIHKAVQQISLATLKGKISISAGIASYSEHALSSTELINRADQALYMAKMQGRNRVAIFQRFGDKRRQQRYSLDVDGTFFHNRGPSQNFATKNISRGGLLVETKQAVSLGTVVRITIDGMGMKTPIHCVGSVVHLSENRNEEKFELGLSILHMDVEDELRYIKLLRRQSKRA